MKTQLCAQFRSRFLLILIFIVLCIGELLENGRVGPKHVMLTKKS
jgi:hypothetical protein